MLTRRAFLARTVATLAALGAGIRPSRQRQVIGGIVPKDGGEPFAFDGLYVMDNFGIDIAALRRSLQESTDEQIALELIANLTPDKFSSPVEYTQCVDHIKAAFCV